MQCPKLYILVSRFISPVKYAQTVHTSACLQITKKKRQNINLKNPTPAQEKFLQENIEYLNNLEGEEEEYDNEELNFMKGDEILDSHYRQKEKWKDKVGKKIVVQKFFAPAKEPSMLTYNERMCIKYLHAEDPIQWNIKTLSESFPANVSAITKVLRSKWKVTPERQKKIDANVQKNWQLLEEGKLEASPEFIDHVKTFVNKRELLLEQIKNSNFYLPEIKKEPVWNQGEMNSILQSYEKLIEHLGNKYKETKKLTDGSPNQNSVQDIADEENSSSDFNTILKNKINEKGMQLKSEKESFMLGQMFSYYNKEITHDKLIENTLKKVDNKKQLSLSEKAILEMKLGNNKKEPNHTNSEETEIQNNLEKKVNNNEISNFQRKKEIIKPISKKRTSLFFENPYEDSESYLLTDKREMDELKPNKLKNGNTLFFTETDLRKNFHKDRMLVEPKKEAPYNYLEDSERAKRDNLYYENEVNDIKDTPFWNSNVTSKSKQLIEIEKDSLHEPNDDIQLKKAAIYNTEPYPERIKIPKNKRRLGAIYKINDCFYDDDGEFLYRVPGMIN